MRKVRSSREQKKRDTHTAQRNDNINNRQAKRVSWMADGGAQQQQRATELNRSTASDGKQNEPHTQKTSFRKLETK